MHDGGGALAIIKAGECVHGCKRPIRSDSKNGAVAPGRVAHPA